MRREKHQLSTLPGSESQRVHSSVEIVGKAVDSHSMKYQLGFRRAWLAVYTLKKSVRFADIP